jgi:hypothetical protein
MAGQLEMAPTRELAVVTGSWLPRIFYEGGLTLWNTKTQLTPTGARIVLLTFAQHATTTVSDLKPAVLAPDTAETRA